MKKLLLFLSVACFMCSCGNKNQFTITGEIVPATEGDLILYKYVDGNPVGADTSVLADSKFKFIGETDVPSLYIIGKADTPNDYIAQLFVENGKINMTIYPDSFQSNIITGSKSQDLFQMYIDEMRKSGEKGNEIRNRYTKAQSMGDDAEMEAVRTEYSVLIENEQLFTDNFIKENNNSPVSAYVYLMNYFQQAQFEELDSMLKLFDPSISNSEFVKLIQQRADELQRSAVGSIAPDFSFTDTTGKQISLSSLKGKYVLIDFWATWCQPCMMEMPATIALYNAYNRLGLEVIAISLDQDEDAWKEIMKSMNMSWINYRDMNEGKEGEIADLYAINTIPHSILIDKDGIIIARELSGDELQAKLASLLD